MKLWSIEPNARPEDPRWLDHPMWSRVVVRAPTASLARVAAEKMEYDKVAGSTRIGNETHGFQSGFADEKLYVVKPLPAERGDWPAEGPEAVLDARRA